MPDQPTSDTLTNNHLLQLVERGDAALETCRCGAGADVLLPAETFGADEGEPVPMCFPCADRACEAAGGEVLS